MHSSRIEGIVRLIGVVTIGAMANACVRTQPPPLIPDSPTPPPQAERTTTRTAPPPPEAPPSRPSPPPLTREDEFSSRSLEELNRESPLEPLFFLYDSSELDTAGQTILEDNAEVLDRYNSWVITIEGHCDERGTPEYNLGLGERRALIAREYLVQLGIEASRIRTVSYGKEFPFDPGTSEDALARNRRAHFVITEK